MPTQTDGYVPAPSRPDADDASRKELLTTVSGTVICVGDISGVMTLEGRLRDLCDQGNRPQATSLAKAALANERIDAVVLDHDTVHIETPRFRGVHQLRPDEQGRVHVQTAGEYTFLSDLVALTVSTIAVPPRAADRLRDVLADLNDDAQPDDGSVRPGATAPVSPTADVDTPDPPARSPVDILKGYILLIAAARPGARVR